MVVAHYFCHCIYLLVAHNLVVAHLLIATEAVLNYDFLYHTHRIVYQTFGHPFRKVAVVGL